MILTLIPRHLGRAGLLLGALLCWSADPASAYTISLTGGTSGGNPGGQPLYEVSGLVQGDAFNVSWGGVSGLDVQGMVTVNSLTASTASIQVMLDNLSTPISGSDPRVTAFGLEVDGYSSLASAATGGTFLTSADSSNFPGFTIDVCATSGNNCAGGGNGGIPAGGSDTAILDVNGVLPGTLKLSNFALKVQGGPGGNSFELAGVPRPKVPEPASIALAAMGVATLWLGRRAAR
jgi:hypothetical protein